MSQIRLRWSLRDTQVTTAARLDRLLLIRAIAYLLLCRIGLIAQRQCRPSDSRPDTCSIFAIGQIMTGKLHASAAQAFTAFLNATQEAAPH